MQEIPKFGADFLRRLFPTVKWDGSKDVNCLKRKQKNGKDGLYLIPLHLDHFDVISDEEKENAVDILADLEKHPYGNTYEPALPFPFTIKELMAFLGCYRDFYNMLFERDRYFKIDEVAYYLKMTQIDVFRQLRVGCSGGNFLTPSVYLSKSESINVSEIEGNGSIQQIHGLLEIDAARGLRWTDTGVDGVNLFALYSPCEEPWGAHYQPHWLSRRQFMLSSGQRKSVGSMFFDRTRLVVSHFGLLDYLWAAWKDNTKTTELKADSAEFVDAGRQPIKDDNELDQWNETAEAVKDTAGKPKRQRRNAMFDEIEDIQEKGILTPGNIWTELISRAERRQGCCLHVEEQEGQQVVAWRRQNGGVGHLTRKALDKRLRSMRQ